MNQDKLLRLKQDIDDAKTQVSELTGQRNALLKQLKEEYGCKSLEEATKKQKELQKEIDNLETQIEQGIEELETKYDFE